MRSLTSRVAGACSLPAALLLAAVALTSCGDSDDVVLPDAPTSADRPAAHPQVPVVPMEERALYALERLMRGPQPPRGLEVPYLHRLNLALASADLVALAPHTLKLLSDPKRIDRVVRLARRNADPWHNILYVLLLLPQAPAEVVLAWTEPVLALGPDSSRSALQREAVKLLATLDDPAAAPLLMALLDLTVARRQVAGTAFSALVRHGSPWIERALETVRRFGGPSLWKHVADSLKGQTTPASADPHRATCLAWWSAMIEGSGPTPPDTRPRLKHHAWSAARLWLDDQVARASAGTAGVSAQRVAIGPAPSSVTHGAGWYVAAQHEQAVFSTFDYAFGGKQPAAAARCVLAGWGFEPYCAAVRLDLATEALEPRDSSLYAAGSNCLVDLEARASREKTKRDLQLLLALEAPATSQHAWAINRLIGFLPSAEDPETWALLEGVLRGLRPLTIYQAPLEGAYDGLGAHPQARAAVVTEMLRAGSADPDSLGVALHLVRRSADPIYVQTLEALLAADPQGPRAGTLRRIILFIHGRREDLTPPMQADVVSRLLTWLDGASAQVGASIASVLLDLGEPGARAFAAELEGPRRQAFLQAWPAGMEQVALVVAEAAVDPLGRDTPGGEVQRVLGLAYQCFPDTAAGALEAFRVRANPEHRSWVEVVLDRVRHRAPGP